MEKGINMKNHNESCQCWYCGAIVDNDDYNEKVPLYKEISRSDWLSTTRSVDYQQTEISITRCHRCYKSQKNMGVISNIILVCIILGAIVALICTEGNLWWLTVLIALGLLALYVVVVNKILDNKTRKTGIKNSLSGHPIIEVMEAEGWSLSKPQA